MAITSGDTQRRLNSNHDGAPEGAEGRKRLASNPSARNQQTTHNQQDTAEHGISKPSADSEVAGSPATKISTGCQGDRLRRLQPSRSINEATGTSSSDTDEVTARWRGKNTGITRPVKPEKPDRSEAQQTECPPMH